MAIHPSHPIPDRFATKMRTIPTTSATDFHGRYLSGPVRLREMRAMVLGRILIREHCERSLWRASWQHNLAYGDPNPIRR